MAGPVDITRSPKVREINKRILDKYSRYTPLEKRNVQFRVLQYSDPAEYQKALEKTIQVRIERSIADFKKNEPSQYAKAKELYGEKGLAAPFRNMDIFQNVYRYEKTASKPPAFFDPSTRTIHLSKANAYYVAHELFHLYSYSKDSQGPFSYFESVLKSKIAEGVIEALGLEMAKTYAQAHNLVDELDLYKKAEMPSILLSKDYLERNSFSNDAVLQLLFKGWFRYDEKKGFAPAERAPTSLDKQKFIVQETRRLQDEYRWLLTPKGLLNRPGQRLPGSTIPKSMTITGMSGIRPGTWQGGTVAGPANPFANTQFGQNIFLNRFSALQRQAQERAQRRLQEEARRRTQEALRTSHNPSAHHSFQEAEKKRTHEMETRRIEEEARRRAAEQKRAKELETRRATEEAARRNQEAARHRAAMDSLHNKRNVPRPIDHWKYKPIGPPQPIVPWVHVYRGDKYAYSFKPKLNDILCRRKK